MRSSSEAQIDMKRVTREGENLLAWCKGSEAEETLNLFGQDSSNSYFFVTNARLLWMSSNNDDVLSIPWNFMTELRIGRKRLKNTFGFSFKRDGWSNAIYYPAEYVSREVIKAIESIQSGQVETFILPVEVTTAIKVHVPHGDSNIGKVASIFGIPESKLICSVCGKQAGFCQTEGDNLSSECSGCERSFSEIVDK